MSGEKVTKLAQPGNFGDPSKYDREYDDVYAAITGALRTISEVRDGQLLRGRMTKARVAAVHRKVLAGEPLDGDRERDIADRLRQQLGGDQPAGEDGPQALV